MLEASNVYINKLFYSLNVIRQYKRDHNIRLHKTLKGEKYYLHEVIWRTKQHKNVITLSKKREWLNDCSYMVKVPPSTLFFFPKCWGTWTKSVRTVIKSNNFCQGGHEVPRHFPNSKTLVYPLQYTERLLHNYTSVEMKKVFDPQLSHQEDLNPSPVSCWHIFFTSVHIPFFSWLW